MIKRVMMPVMVISALLMIVTSDIRLEAADEVELNGRDIMVKVDNRNDGEDRWMSIRMTLINKRGRKRVRMVVSYSKDFGKNKKTLMYFKAPADVKGTGFLSFEYDNPGKDDDRWLYLPALKKVRRISGSSKNEYFMGTDFTFDDMGDRSVDEDDHKLLHSEEIDRHLCWVVESTPRNKNYMYSKTVSWIRRDCLVPVKVEYYDRRGGLIKTMTADEIKEIDGIWMAMKMVMNNTSEDHKTILETTEVRYDRGIDDSMFRVSTLQRGRIK